MLKKLQMLVVLAGVSACSSESGPDVSMHDTKYVWLGVSGEVVGDPADGRCVLDQFTGLVWQLRAGPEELHDKASTYTWFDPDEPVEEGVDFRGLENGGRCEGSLCDTYHYAQAVNAQGLCGFEDWRVPLRDELATISDPRAVDHPPTANTRYFHDLEPIEYWSVNDYSFHWDAAWVWSFEYGHDRVDWKHSPKALRLVRGESPLLAAVGD